MSDAFFLSAGNPIATVDQSELEVRALYLLDRPEVRKARAVATILWRNAMAYPAREQSARMDAMIDEYIFHYALRAANSDAQYPKVLRVMEPPHHWFGRDLPGSRWGGASPNFTYRMIPLAHGARYEVRGRITCEDPPTVTYSVMSGSASPVTMSLLDSLDVRSDAGGEFAITIDDTPADGRPNHLQTRPGVDHLLIRDALADWMTQTPSQLRVRLLDQPSRAPITDDDRAKRLARDVLDCLYYAFYCTQSGSGQAPNELRMPMSSAAFGGMPTQWGTKANVHLAADEAFVATANSAGALFRDTTLCDLFFVSLNYWSHIGSLSTAQMAADADGKFTYVIAHEDPGVHNWLDTGGLQQVIYGHRWQAISRGITETPTICARVVKFKDLDKELPSGIQRIDAAGRREQIALREAGFKRRFIEQ